MTRARAPIARIRLARSTARLLAVPLLLFVVAGATVAAGLLVVPPPAGFVLIGAGAVLALIGLALMVALLSIRLDVEEAAVHVTWIGGGRVYVLSPGPVTRVRLRGHNASRLRARSGVLGWGLGRAVLRDEEPIQIVRLAPTPTAILVPTDRGRLAIAPARDEDLLDALSKAAHARQRQDARIAAAVEPPETDAAAVAPAVTDEAPPDVEAREVAEPPRPLTGIERALLEERLGAERAAAEAAAIAAAAEAEAEPIAEVAPAVPTPEAEAAVSEKAPGRRTRIGVQRPGARAVFVFLPMLCAGLAWGIGIATGRMPDPGSDLARLTSLALVMAGPATSVGAIMAMAWWPRLVGVVVTGGLAASVFIGRALFGP
jgi:hypothetical protein